MTVADPTSSELGGIPVKDVLHPGKATTWATGSAQGEQTSTSTLGGGADSNFAPKTGGKLEGDPVSIIPGTTTPAAGVQSDGARQSTKNGSTDDGQHEEPRQVASGSKSNGQWKWPWQRGGSHTEGNGAPQGSNEQNPQVKAVDPKENTMKGAQAAPDNSKDIVEGGYPMNASTDDPARSAFGEENPEAHNTDPFKSK
jgi:hypothetical protein